jgi:hypothetical protein
MHMEVSFALNSKVNAEVEKKLRLLDNLEKVYRMERFTVAGMQNWRLYRAP